MEDETIAQFTSITDATATQAEQYLRLTEGNLEQAIQLFFEDPSLASAIANPAASSATPQPAPGPAPTAASRKRKAYGEDESGVIQIDSDDELQDDDFDDVEMLNEQPAASGPDTTDDAELARRLQEEMYAGADSHSPGGVRAPIERVRQTLVGGDEFDDGDVSAMIQEQIRMRESRVRARAGIFNQRDTQSAIWNDGEGATDAQRMSLATGGASDRSAKASSLAEKFRPPFEMISRLTVDEAREEGKENNKWLLVNVQDPSIFDCQVLNRDLWKDKNVQDTIKENFIFLQYSNDDPRGMGYIQYYFNNSRQDANAYPHIAILDPRTGERVKVWSGPPPPKPSDFIMQLYEFLDRYSLNEDAKNPVAKRKPERQAPDIERMTEEQMLELAMQNSLAPPPTGSPTEDDPDELTKSVTMEKGKGRAGDAEASTANGTASTSPFAAIPSDRPHTEPTNDPASTTRIQFRYSGGRTVRRFQLSDPVQRIYEWLKAEPIDGKTGVDFDLMLMGRNLINNLHETIEEAGLKNASVMVEFAVGDE